MINFDNINVWYRRSEADCIQNLLTQLSLSTSDRKDIRTHAESLVAKVRAQNKHTSIVAELMQKYQLSTTQGLTLMCLAEALLRIPDTYTVNQLLSDKLPQGEWDQIVSAGDSTFVKVSHFALRLSASLLKNEPASATKELIQNALSKASLPFIREATRYAMKLMAQQFITGRTIEDAIKHGESAEDQGYRYSYDMLGESAITFEDAERYFESYRHAINVLGRTNAAKGLFDKSSISIKLSALHPRFDPLQKDTMLEELFSKVFVLAKKCHEKQICMTIDAEEADRLEMTLEIFQRLFQHPELQQWEGLGLAVQAYQKRASFVIDELITLAQSQNKKMHIRLVKGAYWDSEIKRAQVQGLNEYPVYTRKPYTDVSYISCAQKLLNHRHLIFPGFATHNAQTIATILKLAGKDRTGFEFQRLHGMGQELYKHVVGADHENVVCRIYAPVGSHHDLLPYLVRRLLENGANSSFVHHLMDHNIQIEHLIQDPLDVVEKYQGQSHPQVPLPIHLYSDRQNSAAFDLSDRIDQQLILEAIDNYTVREGGPIINGRIARKADRPVVSPYNKNLTIGHIAFATSEDVVEAFNVAEKAFPAWSRTDVNQRANCLRRMADLLEEHSARLIALCVKEAGKTISDGLAEVREAIDFCRYYALQAEKIMEQPQVLSGPTGEHNQISLHGRGVFVCVSPWNFPLAIFTGQVAAALVTGNCVLAKPATQTTLIAVEAVKLFHEAGIPTEVLHMLPGSSKEIGEPLIADPRTAGIALTGSVATSQAIYRRLAMKNGPIVPFIAETGGQNVMIVDSSALLEQVVKDVMISSFQSAGQRCSALRVLFLQEEIADRAIEMIRGAMATLRVGSPEQLSTDVPSVIDALAYTQLQKHIQHMQKEATLVYECELHEACRDGYFVPPTAFTLPNLNLLKEEKFGPVLHILRYKATELDQVIDQVNGLGFGLTFGIHSRIQRTIDYIHQRIRVGNTYVNRSMIGAVVGVQPFGGEGLSGTGPKAGGPHYLYRFVTERTLSVNTTAQGGNAALMMLEQ